MAQARRMVKTADAAGKLYMVSQSRRYNARHAGLARALADGRIGALTTLNCAFYIGAHFGGFREAMPSPLILDMSIHHFDLMRCILGADIDSVQALSTNAPWNWNKGDATIMAQLELSNHCHVNYFGSWVARGRETGWNANWRP